MRVVMAAALLVVGCGHKPTPSNRMVATLPESDGTPVWMGVANGLLLVAVNHGEVGAPAAALLTINPKSGETRQLAGSLPVGSFQVQDGKLLVAAYIGEVGSVDLTSGAYTKLVAVDGSATAVAATPQGFLVGTSGHVELYAADGSHHAVAGSETGTADVNEVVTTPAGVFAASQLGGVVLRIDGDRATVVADHQAVPGELSATKTHVVWTTGEGTTVGQHLVGMPLAGGAIVRLADATAPALIAHVATTDTVIACSTAVDHKGEILTVTPGSAPKTQVAADARLLAIIGDTLYWIEETPKGWTVNTAAARS